MVSYIVLGIIIGGVIAYILLRLSKNKKPSEDGLKHAVEHLILIAKDQLSAQKDEIKTDLVNKKEAIEKIVKELKEELKHSNKKIEEAERERIGSFRELKQEVENQRKMTEQLSVTTDGLKKVLSNNQLRGQFGEQVAEDLLKMTGFVKGVDYEFNRSQKEAETRPDFTIFLPDKVKINVDSKFPYANLQKAVETQDASAKKEHIKAFERDIKDKIKQVTTRDYINPQDNTVDFVIMFIPNEMIFSFIYDKMNSVWSEAMRQKVIFAGPFSFTAILRLIRQSYDNFKYQKNVTRIITYIKTFEEEFKKYSEEFEKIGSRINALSEQYDRVNTTRTKQLTRSIDKIKIEEAESSNLLTEPDL